MEIILRTRYTNLLEARHGPISRGAEKKLSRMSFRNLIKNLESLHEQQPPEFDAQELDKLADLRNTIHRYIPTITPLQADEAIRIAEELKNLL